MKATETPLLRLLDWTKQFLIPTYQRTYSWTLKQCQQLWDDILRVWSSDQYSNHFIGGILYVIEEWTTFGWVLQASVIDGQQRITTCSLLLYALAEVSKQQWNEQSHIDIMQGCIINSTKNGDQRYKLLPTKLDKEKYIAIIEWTKIDENDDSNMATNYNFFKEKISQNAESIETIYKWIAKLFIVDIALDRVQDNPQLIFESMNSTGLALSKAELIKNYLLMWLKNQEQTLLYEQYRFPMDKILESNSDLYDMFIRDYLTFKDSSWAIPTMRALYDEFKIFLKSEPRETVDVLKDISKAFNHYSRFTLLKPEMDGDIKEVLMDIDTLQATVAYPLMLELFWDYEENKLDKEHLLQILRLIESYVFRRAICWIPTNSMNKTFSTFKKYLKKDNSQTYYESFVAYLMSLDSYKAFPTDEAFEAEFLAKDVYNFRSCKYLLEKIENHDKKERVSADNYTIEHIMPQNTPKSPEWKEELWGNRKDVYDKYLHTIGNITLTGYNSEYSDRPFKEKKTMEGKWFNASPVWLNGMIKSTEIRNEEAIINRAKQLAVFAKHVWPYEKLSDEVLAKYINKEVSANKHQWTYATHKYLTGNIMDLYQKFKEKVVALHPDVKEEIQKLYIAFKYQTNFVDVEPQKNKLRLTLNMDFEEIKDPNGICRDVTWVGTWGNGNVSVHLKDETELEYILWLVKQSFDKQFE